MNVFKLSGEETREFGPTHKIVIDHTDLTTAAANTAQDITLLTLGAKQGVNFCATNLVTPFADADDADFNTTPLVIGDAGSANRFLASQELNVNGTEILCKGGTGTNHAYPTATAVRANFGSMTGKSLVNIDTGEVEIFLGVYDLNKI